MHRLTGYAQGTFTAGTQTISSANTTVSASWSLDSQGNRYDAAGTYGTSYTSSDESSGSSYSAAGNTTTVTFDASRSVLVTYDAWGRVAGTCSTPRVGGPNGSATYTTYDYDALGRLITTTNGLSSGGTNGTQTYYDGANPIEVRELNNTAPLLTNVWSPADGRLILRDAVAAQLSADTGLSIAGNSAGGTIQRLYPLTDALGSIVAVADPSGTVQERYLYTVDGLPQAVSVNWTARTVGTVLQYASILGWNWLYRGEQWVQTQPDTASTQWRGIYVSLSGQWYDPVHARTFQPNLAAYADPQTNPYQMTAWEKFGATAAPVILGIGVTLATGGLGALIAAALGGAVICGLSSYAAGSDASQIAQAAVIGGIAGAAGGAAGQLAGAGAGLLGESLGLTCENGLGMAGGLLMGAAEGGAYGAAEGFTRTALTTGNLTDAVMAGWNGGVMGVEIGGPLGALFHQVCFTGRTLLNKANGPRRL